MVMAEDSQLWILGGHFFTLICSKFVLCFIKTKINETEVENSPFLINSQGNVYIDLTTSQEIIYTSGQSYKGSEIVNYDSRVVPDLKIPHIMILES